MEKVESSDFDLKCNFSTIIVQVDGDEVEPENYRDVKTSPYRAL